MGVKRGSCGGGRRFESCRGYQKNHVRTGHAFHGHRLADKRPTQIGLLPGNIANAKTITESQSQPNRDRGRREEPMPRYPAVFRLPILVYTPLTSVCPTAISF